MTNDPFNADVLLVGDESDSVICATERACRRRGLVAAMVSRQMLVRCITISRDQLEPELYPDLPLLLRWDHTPEQSDPEQAFIRAEERAQLWAAVTLMRSPVINRPTVENPAEADDRSLLVQLLRVAPRLARFVPPEYYVSSLNKDQCGWEQVLLSSEPISSSESPSGNGSPHRARRRLQEGWIYLLAIVVGERTWIRNDCFGSLDWLRYESLAIARTLKLSLCTILWRARPLALDAEVARISAYPHGSVLGGHLDVVAESLVDLLMK